MLSVVLEADSDLFVWSLAGAGLIWVVLTASHLPAVGDLNGEQYLLWTHLFRLRALEHLLHPPQSPKLNRAAWVFSECMAAFPVSPRSIEASRIRRLLMTFAAIS